MWRCVYLINNGKTTDFTDFTDLRPASGCETTYAASVATRPPPKRAAQLVERSTEEFAQ